MDFNAWIEAARQALPGITLAGLTTEFTMLGLAIVLGLLQLSVAARIGNSQRGIAWNVGPRDQPSPPVSAVAGRLERAYRNFMETFPFFVAAILAAHAAGRFGTLTLVGSQVYLIARVVYWPLYAAGVPVFRTLTWLVSLIGLLMVVAALFVGGAQVPA
jgi:uncharacterized MAPEG superfamily protein